MAMTPPSDSRNTIRRHAWITLLLTLIAVATLYAAAWTAHARFDWTEDRIYTLSPSTHTIIQQLEEPIQIRAYITSGLPQPYGALRRFIGDMLASYHDASSNISYEIIDPATDPNVEASLTAMGVPKVQVQVIEDDQAQVRQGYIAIVIEYLDKKATIPVVQGEAGFEYLLTRKIKQVTGTGQRTIGIVGALGDHRTTQITRLRRLANDDYQLVEVDPDNAALPTGLSALIITGLHTPPSALFRYRVQQFRLQGHGLLLLAGNALPQLDRGFRVQPVDRYTNDWIKQDTGIVVRPGLVLDRDASRVMVNQQQGQLMFRSAVDYPFMPAVHDLNSSHATTHGLKQVALPFVSPLVCVDDHDCTILMRTSPTSAVQNGPPFDVDPMRNINSRFAGIQQAAQVVAIAKTGALHGTLNPPNQEMTANEATAKAPSDQPHQRLIVIGAPALLDDTFMDGDNSLFTLNMLDWLSGNGSLIDLRSRGVTERPLDNLNHDARAGWKAIWTFLLPLLVAAIAIGRWRMRVRKSSAE